MMKGKLILGKTFNRALPKTKEEIDFDILVNNIWEIFKNQNPSIIFDLKIEKSAEYFGDSFRLKIIFENLISNAIKYQNPSSDIKKIDLLIKINSNNLYITVSDNGIGIDNQYLESVFNLFFRTEDALHVEGTGIGLYLVKEALNKIGGKIDVTSQTMKGSSFHIVIPNNI
jgi:signal transduction histidine kinase